MVAGTRYHSRSMIDSVISHALTGGGAFENGFELDLVETNDPVPLALILNTWYLF